MTNSTMHRISRRGNHAQVSEPRTSIDAPCLHADLAVLDTGR